MKVMAITGDERPEKKQPRPPKVYTNTRANILRSLERLTRFSLKPDVTPEQLAKLKTAARFLGLRLEMEKVFIDSDRLELSREKFTFERRVEERLQHIEDLMAEQKTRDRE